MFANCSKKLFNTVLLAPKLFCRLNQKKNYLINQHIHNKWYVQCMYSMYRENNRSFSLNLHSSLFLDFSNLSYKTKTNKRFRVLFYKLFLIFFVKLKI